MPTVNKVLVVGGGISGMCLAIELRKRGLQVDLIEIDPHWQVYGAGITLSGPTLRALAEMGVIDAVMREGWCADGVDLCTPLGEKLAELPTPRVGRPDVPGGGAIMRPVLARILREETLASGAMVRCGASFNHIEQDADAVHVSFSDGRQESYDLLVGADGLHSKVREAVFPDAPPPSYTGQASWRCVVPRPPEITRARFFMGERIKAGVNPVSQDEMYLFVTEPRSSPDFLDEAQWPTELRRLLSGFGGVIADIRETLDAHSRILYRPFFATLLPAPWHRGRVVLIGDAVHATTPHLASGAGIGVEDAIVLAQELGRGAGLGSALDAFTLRRYERCRLVVHNSLKLGEIESHGGPREAHAQLMRESMAALLAPI